MVSLVTLTLDEQRYGLPLRDVERVVRVVEITPLPDAPDIVAGVVNVAGAIVAVIDLRKRFLLPAREMSLSDHLIIAHTRRRTVALLVDAVVDVVECNSENMVNAESVVPGMSYVRGLAKLSDGLLLIHDLDSLLSLEEDRLLEGAMNP
jgi:purine-binding chemotaxis protein CheW